MPGAPLAAGLLVVAALAPAAALAQPAAAQPAGQPAQPAGQPAADQLGPVQPVQPVGAAPPPAGEPGAAPIGPLGPVAPLGAADEASPTAPGVPAPLPQEPAPLPVAVDPASDGPGGGVASGPVAPAERATLSPGNVTGDPSVLDPGDPLSPTVQAPGLQRLLREDAEDPSVFAPLGLVGAVAGGLGASAAANLQSEYNDNIFRAPAGTEPRRGVSRSDFRFIPTATFGLARGVGAVSLAGGLTVGRTLHARNTNLDSQRLAMNAAAALGVGARCSVRAGVNYSRRGTQSDLIEDELIDEDLPISAIASGRIARNVGAGASCRSARGLALSANGQWSERTNANPARQLRDAQSRSVSVGASTPVGPRLGVGVSGGITAVRYPNQLLLDGEVNTTDIWNVGGVLSWRAGPRLGVSGSVGYTEAQPASDLVEPFSGVSWNLAASYSAARLGAQLTTGRGVSAGQGGLANFTVRTTTALTLNYRLGAALSASAGASVGEREARARFLPGGITEFSDERQSGFLGLSYRFPRIFSAALDYNHTRRSSNELRPGFRSNAVILTLRAGL